MIVVDAPLRIVETLIISLTCVDCRWGKGLRGIKLPKKRRIDVLFKGMRRFVVCNPYPVRSLQRGVSDFSEVELMETFNLSFSFLKGRKGLRVV